jgi:hypothetical protein
VSLMGRARKDREARRHESGAAAPHSKTLRDFGDPILLLL